MKLDILYIAYLNLFKSPLLNQSEINFLASHATEQIQ